MFLLKNDIFIGILVIQNHSPGVLKSNLAPIYFSALKAEYNLSTDKFFEKWGI